MELKFRCVYCGDSRKSPYHKHLYINIEKQVFHCFRCNYSGKLYKLPNSMLKELYNKYKIKLINNTGFNNEDNVKILNNNIIKLKHRNSIYLFINLIYIINNLLEINILKSNIKKLLNIYNNNINKLKSKYNNLNLYNNTAVIKREYNNLNIINNKEDYDNNLLYTSLVKACSSKYYTNKVFNILRNNINTLLNIYKYLNNRILNNNRLKHNVLKAFYICIKDNSELMDYIFYTPDKYIFHGRSIRYNSNKYFTLKSSDKDNIIISIFDNNINYIYPDKLILNNIIITEGLFDYINTVLVLNNNGCNNLFIHTMGKSLKNKLIPCNEYKNIYLLYDRDIEYIILNRELKKFISLNNLRQVENIYLIDYTMYKEKDIDEIIKNNNILYLKKYNSLMFINNINKFSKTKINVNTNSI